VSTHDTEREIVDSALTFIPADDRETWVKIGMALQSGFGDAGFDIWDHWSRSAHNYNERDSMIVWKGFKLGEVTISSLFFIANECGWVPEKSKYMGRIDINLKWRLIGVKQLAHHAIE